MKIAITGGNGFIGRRLAGVLQRDGHAIAVLSRSPRAPLSGIRFLRGDLTSSDCGLSDLVRDCDVLFHCAGENHDVSRMAALHVGGTERLVEAVQQEARRQRRALHWVQLSSVGAYGFPAEYVSAERIVTEETSTQPQGIYEVTKTQSDEMVVQASRSGCFTYTLVRPSKVYGPGQINPSLHSLGGALRRGLFFYIGPPGAVATYVHVDDVVDVLRLCGTDNRARGQIFNVSNDCLLEEMIAGISQTLHMIPPHRRLPTVLARGVSRLLAVFGKSILTQEQINGLIRRTKYPYSKLERELAFVPRISVPATIGEAV